ncbi:phage tail tube protein, partial [Salmonella enterica subsp. enterica serovar Montevideo]|nr:phage tail tube protein [Salmonella enterica subsp. enterica serovar Montevideo]
GNQRQGVAFIRVNGMELETMEGASFTPSGITREEVTGSRVYGVSLSLADSELFNKASCCHNLPDADKAA